MKVGPSLPSRGDTGHALKLFLSVSLAIYSCINTELTKIKRLSPGSRDQILRLKCGFYGVQTKSDSGRL